MSTHKALWGIDPTQLRVAAVETSGPCAAVTLQQIEPRTKLPIFNALLTVRVGNDGSIRGADGPSRKSPERKLLHQIQP